MFVVLEVLTMKARAQEEDYKAAGWDTIPFEDSTATGKKCEQHLIPVIPFVTSFLSICGTVHAQFYWPRHVKPQNLDINGNHNKQRVKKLQFGVLWDILSKIEFEKYTKFVAEPSGIAVLLLNVGKLHNINGMAKKDTALNLWSIHISPK